MLLFKCIALINLAFFQTPQHESKDKKMKLFTSGTVAMDVDLEKTGFFQGESPCSNIDSYQSHAKVWFCNFGLSFRRRIKGCGPHSEQLLS